MSLDSTLPSARAGARPRHELRPHLAAPMGGARSGQLSLVHSVPSTARNAARCGAVTTLWRCGAAASSQRTQRTQRTLSQLTGRGENQGPNAGPSRLASFHGGLLFRISRGMQVYGASALRRARYSVSPCYSSYNQYIFANHLLARGFLYVSVRKYK